VLAGLATVGVAFVLMLLWFGAAAIFRRRFQFSLLSLCVLVVAVAVPCSWMAVEMGKAREQREAVEAITKLGGNMWHEHAPGDQFLPLAEQPAPAWLHELLGDDFFTTVIVLSGLDEGADAGLAHLAGLPQLKVLYLPSTQVTDAGLAHLAGLAQLRELWLDNTQVTDAGLQHLAGLLQLELLSLNNNHVTDAGLTHLAGLAQFRELWLDNTQVTDAGLAHLEGLTQLRKLWLDGTRVTDEGVKKLQQALPNCLIVH
jgi:Leucine-rich repeat (LRR) protein